MCVKLSVSKLYSYAKIDCDREVFIYVFKVEVKKYKEWARNI